MSMTTMQKVTLISCSVVCVSLFLPKMLLPRGKKELGQPEVGPGYYPPMMHRLQMPEGQGAEGTNGPDLHTPEVMAKVQIRGGASKSNLISQVISIYGFGILLYILFIVSKMTTRPKGKQTKLESRCPTVSSRAWQKKSTDDELTRLQEKLLETERVMERLVPRRTRAPDRPTSSKIKRASKREEKLLRKLSKINRLLQDGRPMEGATPEMEAEMVPYAADWKGYPEETYPEYEEPCRRRSCIYDPLPFIILEEPSDSEIPTAEALAEEVVEVQGEEVEEEMGKEELLCSPLPSERGLDNNPSSPRRIKKQIRFSDHKDVFTYPKQDAVTEYTYEEVREGQVDEAEGETEEEEEFGDEDDPLMEAEALSFNSDACCNPEAEAEGQMEDEDVLFENTDVYTRSSTNSSWGSRTVLGAQGDLG
ncbi:hypothetical protein DPEC_G00255150 [Dallia pectoralis]|uniref:Uncharacterized protein n=1 Tax=Dallia pectoralis TaxID=75939 RepID=A0ACC2FUB4_DALPE|nr:hypothetical protein DPEC_G00255150 [Dallia pectoralis]